MVDGAADEFGVEQGAFLAEEFAAVFLAGPAVAHGGPFFVEEAALDVRRARELEGSGTDG